MQFKHKPFITEDDIPDLKSFLVYLKENNPELHRRYMKQIQIAFIADLLVVIFFITSIALGIAAFGQMIVLQYMTKTTWATLIAFLAFIPAVIVSSIFGRRAHTEAIRIESEIIVAYNKSGFKGL